MDRRTWVLALLAAWGCAEPLPAVSRPPARAIVATVAPGPTDALLSAARASLTAGALAPELGARLRASQAPVHARARRLLTAMHAPGARAAARDDEPLGAVAPLPVTSAIEPPAVTEQTDAPPAPPQVPAASPVLARTAGREAVSAPAPRQADGPTRLHRLALARSKGGAALSIAASRGVLVGVASQPEAGLVRLVLDDVVAAPAVLASRPGLAGVRVRDVAATRSSVRITLALEPGWSFAGVQRTGAGAKVRLRGP